MSLRRVLTSGAAWLLGAAASVAVGLVALSLIGIDLGARGVSPLMAENATVTAVASGSPEPSAVPDARRAAPSTGAATPTPSVGAAAPSPFAAARADQVLRSDGGFVVARCVDEDAYLVSWTPEQGYQVHDVRRGPAEVVSVEFEGERQSVRLDVSCEKGVAQARAEQEHEDEDEDE